MARSQGVVFNGEPVQYFADQVYLLSTDDDLPLENVVSDSADFQISDSKVPNLGVTNQTHWVRIPIENASEKRRFLLSLAYPIVDEVDFYLYDSRQTLLTSIQTGKSRVYSTREYSFKDFVFPVDIEPGQKGTVFLRLKTGEQLMLPLKLQTYDSTVQENLGQDILFGVYAGIIAVMFLYNLFIFFSTRDRAYLLYVIYILTIGLTQTVLQGYGFQFFWPNSPGIAVLSTYVVGVLSGITVLLFAREFLKVRDFSIWVDNIILGFVALDTIALVLALTGNYNISYNLINMVAGLGSLYLVVVAARLALKGLRAARFFIVAWSIFLASIVLYVLKDFGVIAYNDLTDSVLMVGSAIEVVLLSLALADRINILKIESQEAQRRELDAVKEKEKFVTEQNIVLEQRVNERTEELQLANNQLNHALEDLKNAQAQLVNAEKMASLGQLTAGIAHEINNPINFVAASVTPLKRDLQELVNLVEKYDGVLREAELNDKATEMKKYRENIDYEFTIEEIGELLRGVDEGAKRTAEIVQGLKNFSRLDESESKFADIHECIESTLVVLRNMMPENIRITKNFDKTIPEIECFPGKLNQLFSNIIVNAIQAMEHIPSPTLEIVTQNMEESVRVSIADNGPGIPQSIRDKVFEPFFTTKDVGKGTGLGLSIVHSIIEQHRGTVEIETEVGKGTAFIFTLPKSIF